LDIHLSDFEKKTTCTANFLPYSGHGIKPLQLVKSEAGGGGAGITEHRAILPGDQALPPLVKVGSGTPFSGVVSLINSCVVRKI